MISRLSKARTAATTRTSTTFSRQADCVSVQQYGNLLIPQPTKGKYHGESKGSSGRRRRARRQGRCAGRQEGRKKGQQKGTARQEGQRQEGRRPRAGQEDSQCEKAQGEAARGRCGRDRRRTGGPAEVPQADQLRGYRRVERLQHPAD